MRVVFLDADDVRIRFEAACFPIEQLWGPAVPVEMLRDEAHAAWTDQHPRVLRESERLIGLLLAGAQIGASPRKRKAA